MNQKRFSVLFFILLFLDLAQVYGEGTYRPLTKPLIMISLISYYCWHQLTGNERTLQPIFLIGLFGALAGDVFLLSDKLFVWGLGSFLLMQLSYIYTFWKDRQIRKAGYIFGLVLLLIIGTVATFLWSGLGGLKIPVLIYMCAIGGMSWTAFIRRMDIPGYKWVFAGTLFFVISDSVLAIHQFDAGLDLGRLTVMSTYGLAQYLIVTGIIRAH